MRICASDAVRSSALRHAAVRLREVRNYVLQLGSGGEDAGGEKGGQYKLPKPVAGGR